MGGLCPACARSARWGMFFLHVPEFIREVRRAYSVGSLISPLAFGAWAVHVSAASALRAAVMPANVSLVLGLCCRRPLSETSKHLYTCSSEDENNIREIACARMYFLPPLESTKMYIYVF